MPTPAFGRGVFRHLECLTCGADFRRFMWRWSDPDDPRNSELTNTCDNPSCPLPHVRFKSTSNSSLAQVRASQRAVVYEFPDGSWAQPGTNDPNDPVAQESVRDGGVRREFYHTREMGEFQRRMRKIPTDETSGYNDVIDMDESTRRQRDANTLDISHMRMREGRLRDAFEIMGGNSGRYEQAMQQLREHGLA